MARLKTRLSAVGGAVVALAASLAASNSCAAIVTSGAVTPDPLPASPVIGVVNVGSGGTGTLTVNAGSSFTAERMNAGSQAGDSGTITVTGAGSQIRTNVNLVSNSAFRTIDIGSQGTGRLEVLGGASFTSGTGDSSCISSFCRLQVSNGAGSTGSVLVSGAGSTLNAFGRLHVGWAAVGNNFGSAGGQSSGRMDITQGGVVTSNSGQVGSKDFFNAPNGTESANGTVVIDGLGSQWNLQRTGAQLGASLTLLGIGTDTRSSGSVQVRNGALLRIDGGGSSDFGGINMGNTRGADMAGTTSSLSVTGERSALVFTEGNGFINVGRGLNATSTLDVLAGGRVGNGLNGNLVTMHVGRGGGTGTLNVDGSGSNLQLNRTGSVGSAAFLHVGRHDGVAAGTGTVNVTNGGQIGIDTSLSPFGSQPGTASPTGLIVGNADGSVGTMNINGFSSRVRVTSSTPYIPYVGIGRDGGSGTLNITGGGQLQTYIGSFVAPGDDGRLALDVGRRMAGEDGQSSTGTLRISGFQSALLMIGPAEGVIHIGRTADDPAANPGTASGTVEITAGGRLEASSLHAGTGVGATGAITLDRGRMQLTAVPPGGANPPGPAVLSLGSNGGDATMTLRNRSTLTIEGTASAPRLELGGSAAKAGGTGTLIVEGGQVALNGVGASLFVGHSGSATSVGAGTLVISGANSSVRVDGSGGNVVIAREANTVGNVVVGAGSTLAATRFIGVGHNGTASTGGNATLVVDGFALSEDLIIGTGGYLGGVGRVFARVTNFGTINAGNSPGRLTINGALDSSQGEIVLEVQDLGNGQWAYDEIVLGNPAALKVAGARIRFEFLGASDPTAFETAGLFELDTFFKELDANGNVVDLDPDRSVLFDAARWTANAAEYVISNFVFSPTRGASFTAVPLSVPVPATLALALVALAMLGIQRRPRA